MTLHEATEILKALSPIIIGILAYIAGNIKRESETADKALRDNADKLELRVKALEDAQIAMASFTSRVETKLENIEKQLGKLNGMRQS